MSGNVREWTNDIHSYSEYHYPIMIILGGSYKTLSESLCEVERVSDEDVRKEGRGKIESLTGFRVVRTKK